MHMASSEFSQQLAKSEPSQRTSSLPKLGHAHGEGLVLGEGHLARNDCGSQGRAPTEMNIVLESKSLKAFQFFRYAHGKKSQVICLSCWFSVSRGGGE